jgi:hypothetical protein
MGHRAAAADDNDECIDRNLTKLNLLQYFMN